MDDVVAGRPFALYVRLVAAQLAVEISGCVPWSLDDYDGTELALLFDGRTSLRYAPEGPTSWGTRTPSLTQN